jgi:hypothetical protein
MNVRKVAAVILSMAVMAPFVVQASGHSVDKALIMLNSGSLQTQGMAMVLGNAMQQQGAQVDVLLCDQAGDLALQATTSTELKPNNVTPEQLLLKLQQGGATVSVCALYLPNSGKDRDALREGVDVAAPPAIGEQMLATDARIFIF